MFFWTESGFPIYIILGVLFIWCIRLFSIFRLNNFKKEAGYNINNTKLIKLTQYISPKMHCNFKSNLVTEFWNYLAKHFTTVWSLKPVQPWLLFSSKTSNQEFLDSEVANWFVKLGVTSSFILSNDNFIYLMHNVFSTGELPKQRLNHCKKRQRFFIILADKTNPIY